MYIISSLYNEKKELQPKEEVKAHELDNKDSLQ